jgi:hypothetical protein
LFDSQLTERCKISDDDCAACKKGGAESFGGKEKLMGSETSLKDKDKTCIVHSAGS